MIPLQKLSLKNSQELLSILCISFVDNAFPHSLRGSLTNKYLSEQWFWQVTLRKSWRLSEEPWLLHHGSRSGAWEAPQLLQGREAPASAHTLALLSASARFQSLTQEFCKRSEAEGTTVRKIHFQT